MTARSTGAARPSSLEELRRALQPYAPKTPSPRSLIPSGHSALDEILGGGLPRGAVTEVAGTAGRMALALGLLAGATQQGLLAAIVDPGRTLDVRVAAALGADLQRLLWAVPPPGPRAGADVLRAGDLLLGSGCFGLVVLSLPGTRLPPLGGSFVRLARRAEHGRAALLVLCDEPLAGAAAALTLRAERAGAGWQSAPGHRSVLRGQRVHLSVVRTRAGPPGAAVHLDLSK